MYSFAIELAGQKKKDNTHSLLLRITRDRKHKRVTTGIAVLDTQFTHTSNTNQWVHNHPQADELNAQLTELIKGIEVAIEEKRKSLKTITLDSLALWVKNKEEESFIHYALKKVEEYKDKESYRTYVRYSTAVNKLKEYREEEDLFFHQLTPRFFKSYRLYLQALGNSEATIYADIACVRIMVNKAIDEGYLPIQDNPFLKLNFKAPSKKKVVYLTQEELEMLEAFKPEEKTQQLAIDCFLFSMYMGGIKFSEVACLKWESILNGKLKLESQAGSLNRVRALQLHGKAADIIKKYQQKTWSQKDFVFPLLSNKTDLSTDEKLKKQISSKNSILNKRLKEILLQLGVEKVITFFSSRHTFAFLANKKSVNMDTLSLLLGHSDVGVTELYLKQIDSSEEDDLLLDVFY